MATPVYYLLEDRFETQLLNVQHLHNVPGRKTDVADAAWIPQLVEHGLVRPSFVPPKPIRRLRDLTHYRKAVTEERGRETQRLHRVLEDAGVNHHALIVGEMLGRIDHAEATIARLSEQIDVLIAPFARQRDLLCTIHAHRRGAHR